MCVVHCTCCNIQYHTHTFTMVIPYKVILNEVYLITHRFQYKIAKSILLLYNIQFQK